MGYLIQDDARASRPQQESAGDLDEIVRRVEGEAKRKLARELHDSVAQTLTLMVVDMEHFKADVAGQSTLVSGIDSLQESAREVLRRLRQVLYELREEPAMDTCFVAYVRAVLARLEENAGVRARLRVSARWPPALSQATVHHLRRILEEALNNVRLHRSVAVVEVGLETAASHLFLRVEDDGTPTPAGEVRREMGLIGMRERAALLGGRLHVATGENGRTSVRVVVPKSAERGMALLPPPPRRRPRLPNVT